MVKLGRNVVMMRADVKIMYPSNALFGKTLPSKKKKEFKHLKTAINKGINLSYFII